MVILWHTVFDSCFLHWYIVTGTPWISMALGKKTAHSQSNHGNNGAPKSPLTNR